MPKIQDVLNMVKFYISSEHVMVFLASCEAPTKIHCYIHTFFELYWISQANSWFLFVVKILVMVKEASHS